MPCLVREHRDRTSGAAPRHVVVEREPVQVVADLGRHDRQVASDGCDTVRVLHGTDVVAGLVTADRDGLARDTRGLG